jgi:hypothetical protein
MSRFLCRLYFIFIFYIFYIFLIYLLGYLFVHHSPHNQTLFYFFFFRIFGKPGSISACNFLTFLHFQNFQLCISKNLIFVTSVKFVISSKSAKYKIKHVVSRKSLIEMLYVRYFTTLTNQAPGEAECLNLVFAL